MNITEKTALGVIDALRTFMPAAEGERLGLPGFGELPVPGGELIVPNVNDILGAFAAKQLYTFDSSEWHQEDTPHFSDQPNFATTWPKHGIANTPGAELHPEIVMPPLVEYFKKGSETIQNVAEDKSYTGVNGVNRRGQTVGQALEQRDTRQVVLVGLALDYCIKATALGLREMGIEVVVVEDATAPVTPETGLQAIQELEAAGVEFTTTEDLLEQFNQSPIQDI